MAKMVLRHNGHAFIHSVLGTYEKNRAGHDLVDLGFSGRLADQDSFARVVTLRQDADQEAVREDQQGADIVLGHFLERLVDRLIGCYRQNPILVFALQHESNCVRASHPTLLNRGSRVCGSSQAAFVIAARQYIRIVRNASYRHPCQISLPLGTIREPYGAAIRARGQYSPSRPHKGNAKVDWPPPRDGKRGLCGLPMTVGTGKNVVKVLLRVVGPITVRESRALNH
jgi:hypothetical protein